MKPTPRSSSCSTAERVDALICPAGLAERARHAGEDEISVYKDRFAPADRALLLLDHLRRSMGAEGFLLFAKDLFDRSELTLPGLYGAVEAHLPGGSESARIWLETTEYPERIRRP